MEVKNEVNSNGLKDLESEQAKPESKQNQFFQVQIVKRPDVSIHYILVGGEKDDDREFKTRNGLIEYLKSECDDVMMALSDSYNSEREGSFDEYEFADFCSEHAISTAEDLGYVIHKPIRSK